VNSSESIAPDSLQESSWLVWFPVVEKGRDSGVAWFPLFVGEFVAEIVPALCSLFFKSAPIVEIFVL
jgi:hypothetical protein